MHPPGGVVQHPELSSLKDQVEELSLVREENNKEMIRLETELANERQLKTKCEEERDQLIVAIDDLTTKANQVEQTLSQLKEENLDYQQQNEELVKR